MLFSSGRERASPVTGPSRMACFAIFQPYIGRSMWAPIIFVRNINILWQNEWKRCKSSITCFLFGMQLHIISSLRKSLNLYVERASMLSGSHQSVFFLILCRQPAFLLLDVNKITDQTLIWLYRTGYRSFQSFHGKQRSHKLCSNVWP